MFNEFLIIVPKLSFSSSKKMGQGSVVKGLILLCCNESCEMAELFEPTGNGKLMRHSLAVDKYTFIYSVSYGKTYYVIPPTPTLHVRSIAPHPGTIYALI